MVSKLERDTGVLYYYPALQVAAMLDRVLLEASKIPELENLIAEVIQVDVERLLDSRLLGLSKKLEVDLFTERCRPSIRVSVLKGTIKTLKSGLYTGSKE